MQIERKKSRVQLGFWTLSWLVTLALATFGPKFIWDDHSIFTILAVVVNLVNGVLMILANRKMFNHYDELERKIHLESMGLTLGLAIIVGLTYSLLDQTNLIQSEAEIGLLVGFIGISYLIALLINRRRYL
jgi:UDP-N-acetylmuramyl pentapeptide phosphotransferase/UDP-N-acetylglucosamine-1-phosphate transferase